MAFNQSVLQQLQIVVRSAWVEMDSQNLNDGIDIDALFKGTINILNSLNYEDPLLQDKIRSAQDNCKITYEALQEKCANLFITLYQRKLLDKNRQFNMSKDDILQYMNIILKYQGYMLLDEFNDVQFVFLNTTSGAQRPKLPRYDNAIFAEAYKEACDKWCTDVLNVLNVLSEDKLQLLGLDNDYIEACNANQEYQNALSNYKQAHLAYVKHQEEISGIKEYAKGFWHGSLSMVCAVTIYLSAMVCCNKMGLLD